jgi:hypothetical protein
MGVDTHLACTIGLVASLGCGPGPGQTQLSESESTTTDAGTESETGSSTDTDESDTDGTKLDAPPEPEPKPHQLVLALGRGVVDGAASFAAPQHFSAVPGRGLTTLHDASEAASYVAIFDREQICLAGVSRQGDAVTLAWHECIQVLPIGEQEYAILDAARMDADGDGVDELLLMKLDGALAVFRLDPASASGFAAPVEIQTSAIWVSPRGITTGPLDDVAGDEAVVTGTEGDPASGGMSNQAVILHGGQSFTSTLIDQAFGPPYLAELTGDGLPDLLLGSSIYRGTGDVDLVEEHLHIPTVWPLWTMDAQGDGIGDVARVEPDESGCEDRGVLELRVGPFEALPDPVVVDGAQLDSWTIKLPGDLDHDGIDELVSVNVDEQACPGVVGWTLTSVETGTSGVVELCDAADSCALVRAELADADGDGNLDLAALVVILE